MINAMPLLTVFVGNQWLGSHQTVRQLRIASNLGMRHGRELIISNQVEMEVAVEIEVMKVVSWLMCAYMSDNCDGG